MDQKLQMQDREGLLFSDWRLIKQFEALYDQNKPKFNLRLFFVV